MATHARTVVTILPDPWAQLALKCQRDAKAILDSAIMRARADGHVMPSGCVRAAFDTLAVLHGEVMASNAKLAAEVASLRGRVERRGWLCRVFGESGNA